MHVLWTEPLQALVEWSWLRTFLSADLNGLTHIEQFVLVLYFLNCSRVSRFIGILLTRCCVQMVDAARTWSKNLSVASSTIFSWGGSKYAHHLISCRLSSYMVHDAGIGWRQDFDGDSSHESCLHNTRSKSL